MQKLSQNIFSFFSSLAKNNNRDWFLENKTHFKSLETEVKQFGEKVKEALNRHDQIDRFKLFRIYRDVRFSKDKTPYKTHFGLTWHRIKPHYRGGYYLHLSPKDCFLACGFWDPNPADLKRIREELAIDAQEFRDLIAAPDFASVWGKLEGSELKTAPRDFHKHHPDIDLIRKKQFLFVKPFDEKTVCSPDFLQQVDAALQAVRPFVDYMSEVLTTNADGERLV
jgi:uncharacterized protein (TIGR02453 family)